MDLRRQLLNAELLHRLNHTLVIVQSITTQTLRSASSLTDAREAPTRRIQPIRFSDR